ncbi:unnamed protein product [Closterium sp. NIES-54]
MMDTMKLLSHHEHHQWSAWRSRPCITNMVVSVTANSYGSVAPITHSLHSAAYQTIHAGDGISVLISKERLWSYAPYATSSVRDSPRPSPPPLPSLSLSLSLSSSLFLSPFPVSYFAVWGAGQSSSSSDGYLLSNLVMGWVGVGMCAPPYRSTSSSSLSLPVSLSPPPWPFLVILGVGVPSLGTS